MHYRVSMSTYQSDIKLLWWYFITTTMSMLKYSLSSRNVPPSAKPLEPVAVPPKQSGSSIIVGLQQANGSWLLNDQLAGAISKSVQELKECCPVSCDVTAVANIWVTL